MTTTPNMGLGQPTPGSLGPTWANDLNANSSLVDTHDHSSGKGVRITPAGLNINTDLSVASFKLTSAKSVRFVSQSASLAESGAADVYVKDGNLFFASGASDVQLTNGGSIAGASGSIAGLVSPASAVFAGQQFSFFYNSGTYADLRCRDLTLSTNGGSANTVKVTQAATATYTLTLPASPPSTATQLVSMDTAGTLSAPSNPTLGAASSVLTWAGTTQSTAIGNGSVVISGGVSVAKTLRVGDGARIDGGMSITNNGLVVDAGGAIFNGATTVNGTTTLNGASTTTALLTANNGLRVNNGLTIATGGLGIDANGATINGPTVINGSTTVNSGGIVVNGLTTLNGYTACTSQLNANNVVCNGINTDNYSIRQRRILTNLNSDGDLYYAHGLANPILSVTAFYQLIGYWYPFFVKFDFNSIVNVDPLTVGSKPVRLFITYEA